MKRSHARLLLSTLLLSGLTACTAIQAITATDPAGPTERETVRVLCARNDKGEFPFGVILVTHADTEGTIDQVVRHNRAWRAATKDGALCK